MGLYINQISVIQSVKLLIAYLFCMIGVAAFAYLLNDYFDKENDETNNKINFFLKTNSNYFLLYIVVSLFIIAIPRLILPWDNLTMLLLFLLLISLIIYSIPIIRLKTKGIWGVIADSMYAYVISSSLTFYTFAIIMSYDEKSEYFIFGILVIWQFLIGIRSIILHQIEDYNNDLMSHNTWVVKVGVTKGEKLIKRILLPSEITMLIGSLIVISKYFILIIPFSILFWIHVFSKNRYIYKESRIIDYKQFVYTFLDDYYYQCFPVLILIFISIAHPHYTLLLLIHLLIFKNIIFNYLRYFKILLLK